MAGMTFKQMARGLRREVFDPMAKDIQSNAANFMDMQRAARTASPTLNAVTNVVPVVGAAANTDDVVRGYAEGGLGKAAVEATGYIPGLKLVRGFGRSALDVMRTVPKMAGRAGVISSIPAAVYGRSLAMDEQAAPTFEEALALEKSKRVKGRL